MVASVCDSVQSGFYSVVRGLVEASSFRLIGRDRNLEAWWLVSRGIVSNRSVATLPGSRD